MDPDSQVVRTDRVLAGRRVRKCHTPTDILLSICCSEEREDSSGRLLLVEDTGGGILPDKKGATTLKTSRTFLRSRTGALASLRLAVQSQHISEGSIMSLLHGDLLRRQDALQRAEDQHFMLTVVQGDQSSRYAMMAGTELMQNVPVLQ